MDDPTRSQSQNLGEGDGDVPEALRRELERLYSPDEPIDVSREIDRHMAQMARWRLSARVVGAVGSTRGVSTPAPAPHEWLQRRVFPMRLVAISAAAAALLLVVLITPRFFRPATPGSGASGAVAIRGDVDADGRVDIVDALMLSKLAAGDSGIAARVRGGKLDYDMNSDGVLDDRDALAVRAIVVKLPGGAG